ncbi:hypothetical protein GOP47_0017124 [Adiantum capillus-veneris]|uniref:Uncharacterized protein n=1 Tax=Adiantum capillus-veneris TaxID=13818 RepID=A0A9D4UJ05_ADICA|nr:hypothetical protein GOP47_0017124 [Adiantum capillus-veneris]
MKTLPFQDVSFWLLREVAPPFFSLGEQVYSDVLPRASPKTEVAYVETKGDLSKGKASLDSPLVQGGMDTALQALLLQHLSKVMAQLYLWVSLIDVPSVVSFLDLAFCSAMLVVRR